MFPGETITSGAPNSCPTCGLKMQFEVLSSPAGYYIGTQCDCGPYSRESGYFITRAATEYALEHGFTPRK
jgi:hypothetical protein